MFAVGVTFVGIVAVVILLAACCQVALAVVGRAVVEVSGSKDDPAAGLEMPPAMRSSAPFTASPGALKTETCSSSWTRWRTSAAPRSK